MAINNIIKRGQIYHFRYYVPKDKQPYIEGNPKEFTRSLKTDNELTAANLSADLRRQIDEALQLIPVMQEGELLTPRPSYRVTIEDLNTGLSVVIPNPMSVINDVDKNDKLSLGDLIDDYCDYQINEQQSWSTATAADNRASFNLMLRILGDVSVQDMNRCMAMKFKKVILQLPPNMNKNPDYKNLTIAQILSMNPTPMNARTADKSLIRASSLFDWALTNDLVSKNSFKKLNVSKKRLRKDENSRCEFSTNELHSLFDTPLFVHHDQANYTFATQNACSRGVSFNWQYWVLLLLLTGARLAEITGLRSCDVKMAGEFGEQRLVLDINEDGKRRLKNGSAKRLIPINMELINLGFQKFVDQCSTEYLFPELPWANAGTNYRKVTKWFNGVKDSRRSVQIGYKHRCEVVIDVGTKKDLHSFRHSVGSLYKNLPATIKPHIHQYLFGHYQKEVDFTHKTYGDTYDIAVLCDAVDQIDLYSYLNNIRPWEPAD